VPHCTSTPCLLFPLVFVILVLLTVDDEHSDFVSSSSHFCETFGFMNKTSWVAFQKRKRQTMQQLTFATILENAYVNWGTPCNDIFVHWCDICLLLPKCCHACRPKGAQWKIKMSRMVISCALMFCQLHWHGEDCLWSCFIHKQMLFQMFCVRHCRECKFLSLLQTKSWRISMHM